jgi:type VII secretion protein EccB
MQSRRDQVQAYFYVVGRLVSAVVHGKPDSLQQPNKRLNTGTFLGVIVGAVLMGIFGIYGLFVPGGDVSWRQAGAIMMNKDTGARYVYLENQLRPVLNYSSALLASGGSGDGKIVEVSQSSLSGTPVGQPIGIPGAPDALPEADALDKGEWTVCTQQAGGDQENPGPSATLMVGEPLETVLSEQQALLVRGPDDMTYLLWQGKRHRIPGRTEATALGYGGVEPVAVTAAWLNPIPQGQDLAVPRAPNTGEPGPTIDGVERTVGQIIIVRNPALGSEQLYLVRAGGVSSLSPTTAALLLAAPFTKEAYGAESVVPVEVGPGALSGVPSSDGGRDLVEGLPQSPPEVVVPGSEGSACAAYAPLGGGEVDVTLGMMPATVHTDAIPMAAHQAGTTADRVSIDAGGGVLAREQSTPDAAMSAIYLITETGMKYPLANADVVTGLGYAVENAVAVPGELLGLLPAGPLLSAEAALKAQSPA